MLNRLRLLAGLLGFAIFASSAVAQTWPHEGSDLQPDPAVTYGQLPNGLRYIIMPNTEPPGQISMRFAVDAGSIHETEEQRGLAHFLEHMAFNGTRNFPGNSMAEYFQRLGMDFGPDTNAYTSFNETVYFVELPDSDPELLESAFRLMRDYADGMLLEVEEIEAERGIILAEKRDRDSAGYRDFVAAYNFIAPESRLVERLPIGLESVIENSTRQDFVNFYADNYRADRITVIAAGDVTPELIEDYLDRHFGDMPTPEAPFVEPDLGPLPDEGLRFGMHRDPELPEVDLTIYLAEPFDKGPDTRARRITQLYIDLANSIISRRFELLARTEDATFTDGNAYNWDYLDYFQIQGVNVNTTPDNWESAFMVLEQEYRRALEYGFTQSEIDEAVARTLNAYEQAVRNAPTRQNRALTTALRNSSEARLVFMSPEASYELASMALETVNAEMLHAFFVEAWNSPNRNVYASGNLPDDFTVTHLQEALEASLLVPVEPPVEEDVAPFAYTEFGEASDVVSHTTTDDLGITHLTYANNLRVALKATEFEADTVHVSIRFGGGTASQSRDMPALNTVAEATFVNGGVGEHSFDEIVRILAGHTVNGQFSVDDDAFNLYTLTNPDDLLLALQLNMAYITDAAYRMEALSQYRRNLPATYQQVLYDPVGVWQGHVNRFMRSGDPRFGIPLQSDAEARTMGEVEAWIGEALANGYMEVGIVGDFDEAAVMEALDATLATLPERAATKPHYNAGRQVRFPTEIREATFRYPSEIDRTLVAVTWPTTDSMDVSVGRRLNMLGWILGDRMRVRVREETGEAYSPFAFASSSSEFPGFGIMVGLVFASTETSDMFAEMVTEMGVELGANGVTQEELDRGIQTQLSDLEDQVRSNAYWLNTVVTPSSSEPERMDWARSLIEDFSSITVEELNELAATYLLDNKVTTVKILPSNLPEAEEEEVEPLAANE